MAQEEKDLLLKDLCARLPYHPIVYVDENLPRLKLDAATIVWEYIAVDKPCKPYLRPLSSMTEEEKKEILQSLNIHGDIDNEGNLLLGVECGIITIKVCKKHLGELNKRMFDVCHMIEKGLALEAKEGMYKNY